MIYSKSFERDFSWYLHVRNNFNFDGVKEYYNKKGDKLVQYKRDGVSAKKAFHVCDSEGKILPTKHPETLYRLLKTKGSVNLHIKMYAEDLAKCRITKSEIELLSLVLKAPSWFREAIEKQRWQYVV